MLENLTKRFLVGLVRFGSRYPNGPVLLQEILRRSAILALLMYRASLSKWLGRDCLFNMTCSAYALKNLRNYPWNKAIIEIRTRIDDCGGNYSIRTDGSGSIEMITQSGAILNAEEINPAVADRMRPPSIKIAR